MLLDSVKCMVIPGESPVNLYSVSHVEPQLRFATSINKLVLTVSLTTATLFSACLTIHSASKRSASWASPYTICSSPPASLKKAILIKLSSRTFANSFRLFLFPPPISSYQLSVLIQLYCFLDESTVSQPKKTQYFLLTLVCSAALRWSYEHQLSHCMPLFGAPLEAPVYLYAQVTLRSLIDPPACQHSHVTLQLFNAASV